MGTTYYKAVRPDGGSFNDPSFRWAVEPDGVTTHPLYRHAARKDADGAAGYLSVATVATDCTGMMWPCRLLTVEPVGGLWTPDASGLPNKRAGLRFRTVSELPASDVFGPQGLHVAALIARAGTLTRGEAAALAAAGDAAWDAARYAARAARAAAGYAAWDAAGDAARDAAGDAARDAARYAAGGLVVRDLISAEHYDTLTLPWRTIIGSIHPGDAVVTA